MPRTLHHVATRFGEIAYTDTGSGPSALFVHGVFLNGYLWRNVVAGVADLRRCIAIDLLGHGETRSAPDAPLTFDANAEMLDAVCEALGLGQVDLVANDSGGGIAQIFAAQHPERIRTLTLTNCDVHDNWPPAALQPIMMAIAAGRLRELGPATLANPEIGRQTLAVGFEHPEAVSDQTILTYLEPLFRSPERIGLVERWFAAMDSAQTVAIEPSLKRLAVPALIVWGTGDVFFDVAWAHWLHRTLPGALAPVIVEGAKLFFPDERPNLLIPPLRALLQNHAPAIG